MKPVKKQQGELTTKELAAEMRRTTQTVWFISKKRGITHRVVRMGRWAKVALWRKADWDNYLTSTEKQNETESF